jgi:peptide/nickel transport system permease protein
MLGYVIRRLMLIPLILAAVNFLGFAYAHYARPIRAARTPYIRAVEAGPLWIAYNRYLEDLSRFNFNIEVSVPGERDVVVPLNDALKQAIIASVGLMALVLMLSVLLGWIIGTRAVQTDPPGVKRWLNIFSTLGMAMPSFYIGSLFILVSIFYILWHEPGTPPPLPLSGYGWDLHLVFPALALMARPTVQIAQVVANHLSSELGKQYIIAARSLGHSWRSIRNRLALRNILAPTLLTLAGLFRFLFGEQVLIEWLFKWPGLGRLLAWTLVPPQLTSTRGSPLFLHPHVVATVLTIVAAMFLLSDFCVSLAVQSLDPRARQSEGIVGEK